MKRREETDSFVARSNFVNKDPFYRTNDMFNGVFKKRVKLEAGPTSMTDGKSRINVNFNQTVERKIVEELWINGNRTVYELECGHEFVSAANTTHDVGKGIVCHACGGKDAYRSFEHEWSHIIFKSDASLWQEFIKHYLNQLRSEGYEVDQLMGLNEFLYMVINAFDDIRVTSLWELVYPGSAWEIERKWKRLCERDKKLNENFIAWIFGVALDAENLNTQDGPFSDLIMTMVRATDAVRGRGTANMLHAIRWAIDKCVKKLLENAQKKPPPTDATNQDQQQPPQPAATDDADDGAGTANKNNDIFTGLGADWRVGTADEDRSSADRDDVTFSIYDEVGNIDGGDVDDIVFKVFGDSEEVGDVDDVLNPFEGMSKDPRPADPRNKTEAMRVLAAGHKQLQPDQDHPEAGDKDDSDRSLAVQATVQKALGTTIDVDELDGLEGDTTDAAVRDAVQALQSIVKQENSHQFLLKTAKANIVMADVRPRDIDRSALVRLSPDNLQTISRLRAVFARVMGRNSSKMFKEGTTVDVQSMIQYLMSPSEDDVFNVETVIKGFAYMTLCDMSGSMAGDRFNQVIAASEILKRSLDYPFVTGHLWGFRGSSAALGRKDRAGEIWLYRYHKDCMGYLAKEVPALGPRGGKLRVPVECGGLTPMNSSLHVGLKYLRTHVPAGMAKRMFLLTDGCPNHTSTRGHFMSDKSLQFFVAKEINEARSKGMQVYTIIIGDSISDAAALQMFGPKRFWEKANSDKSIGQALFNLVVREFMKYLRSR